MEGQYQTSSCLCTYPLQILQFLTQTASHCHHIADQKKKTLRIQSDPICFLVWSKVFSLYAHIFLLLQLMIFVTQPVSSEDWDGVVITQADYQGLQAFKHRLVDTKGYLQSWNDSGYGACTGGWTGVKCARGQVIVIHLPWKGLGGQITEDIAQLQALRKLSLHDNLLGGSIPAALGFLPNLRGVQLFNNRLSGSIPPSLASCPLLQTLDLGNNSLTGTLPATLANCTKLLRLNVSFNSLSGSIPDSLTTLPSLAILALQNNLFSGSIPDSWHGTEGKTSFHLQSLTLDHNLFSGTIPASLGKLSELQDLSLSHNEISGTIPNDIGNLSMLRSLDCSNNAIRGSLPTSLSNLLSLEVLNLEINHLENQIPETLYNLRMLLVINLGGNHFSGQIPATVGNISMLTQLNLAHNNLTGEIPASLGDLPNLIFLDVSYNDFSGPIPTHLSQKFNSSSFMGNLQLCGYNASTPCPSMAPSQAIMAPFSEQSKNNHHKFSAKDKTLMAAGALLLVLLSLCCILLCCCIRERAASKAKDCQVGGGAGAMKGVSPVEGEGEDEEESGEMGGKLVHFNSLMVFTLEDLLSATAEVIGKSTYGTVYKVMLENGSQVAVKRLRNKFTVNQREFEKNVNVLGKIEHPNLLALRAYYWGLKGEKLLVFDYMPKGSLAAFLHAARPDTTVDWQTRIKIAQGMTRGLFYLHTHQNIIHGNLSSSNILLDEQNNAKVADFGLSLLMTTAANSNVIVTARALGYRAPELLKLKKANTKTDIYSLGVIILELLTGKAPSEMKNGVDLPQWVASYVKQEKTNEVFDSELTKDESTISDKLFSTLKLALQCVEPSASARPEAQHVLQQLEEIRPIKLPRPVIQNNIRSLI